MVLKLHQYPVHLKMCANPGYFEQRDKNLVPFELLSYVSTWHFLRPLEKSEKYSPIAYTFLSTSLVILKNEAYSKEYNSTMHSACFLFLDKI